MLSRIFSDPPGSTLAASAGLTLLLAEDDPVCREVALHDLKNLFRRIIVAEDGITGLQLFRDHTPDLVLSDQLMPGLSGLEMFRRIRAVDQGIPLILMTGCMTNETLLEAINLGVNGFVPKGSDFAVIVRVLEKTLKELVNKRQLEQCRLQEIELLRYRDSHNSMQQEAARRKEHHVARHDLGHRFITGAAGIRWGLHVANFPRDIMCGDGYTIRSLPDGRQFIFVVDAMGSGLSASLSAILATSFCNYLVDHRYRHSDFTLGPFLQDFQEYMGGILLKEEALSCEFILVDLMAPEMELAICGMPPLLVRKLDGSISRIPGANPPLSIYSGVAEIRKYSLAGVADLLLMTDGITDTLLSAGGAYRERLADDFLASPTLAALLNRFNLHTVIKDRDDMTLLHLQRLDLPATWSWSVKPALRDALQPGIADDLLATLADEIVLDENAREELERLLREVLNHIGAQKNSGIGREAEAPLVQGKESDSHDVGPAATSGAGVEVSVSLCRGDEQSLLIIEVVAQEPLPPPEQFQNREDNERNKTWLDCDSYFIGGPGFRLVILKTIRREHANEP